jgi:N-acetylglucosamine kinase-like BadF-type ATPase
MGEDQQVRAHGRGGPSNPMRVGFGGALVSVCEAALSAIQAAGLSAEQIAVLCTGLAGTGQADAEVKMQRLLRQEFPASVVHVCTDLDLTLEAAGNGPAVVLIMGTGSAAVGRDAEGRISRIGGHGPLLGDEGSAYDIGRRASIQAMRHFDKMLSDSALGTRILRESGAKTWADFQSRAAALPDDVFPRIFSVVAGAAENGDTAGRELLRVAAGELAALVGDLLDRLQFRGKKFPLIKTGGMIGRSKYFDQQIDEMLCKLAPGAEFTELLWQPAEAAARIALKCLPALGKAGS